MKLSQDKLPIHSKDPYESPKKNLEFYEYMAQDFYKTLRGNIFENSNLSELEKEYLSEIISMFLSEIKNFEKSVLLNNKSKEKFEIIFLTKERFFEKILQKFSKYLSIVCFGDLKNITNLNVNNLRNVLKRALLETIFVVDSDIPLYELLFKELDEIRDSEKKCEVYIGRDGIYAFEGRRSLDVARRRKLNKENKQNRKLIDIHPKYINYNSLIKDNFSDETKRKFIEDAGIKTSDDPIIFDTGFRGSIPEQILKILGFTGEDLEKRIKILATDYHINSNSEISLDSQETILEKEKIRNRLVRGIKNNYSNYQLVSTIEERAKKYMTASGIFEDQNGKLKPAQNPYLNDLFFEYELIELTIRQYFFNKEYFDK